MKKRRPARSGIAQSRVFNVPEHAAGSQASGPSGWSHGHSQNILERYPPGHEARAIPANMRMVSLPAQCSASVHGAGGAATSASPASASAAMIRLQARSVAPIHSIENWNIARSPRLAPWRVGIGAPTAPTLALAPARRPAHGLGSPGACWGVAGRPESSRHFYISC
jgi:hypothetical protein